MPYKSADQTNCNNYRPTPKCRVNQLIKQIVIIIDQALSYCSLIKYQKKYYTLEYMQIYRNLFCYPIIGGDMKV